MIVRTGAAVLFGCLAFSFVAGAAAPSCNFVPGWKASASAVRNYGQDNLFEYMDGNAEGYLLYNFQTMQGVTCEKDGVTLVLDISDFADPDFAYGFFSNNRDPNKPSEKLGMGGQIVPRRLIFSKGQYYVEIAANPEGDYTAVLREWAQAIEKTLPGSTEPPSALAWFPLEHQQGTRLVPESVLGLRLLERGYVAQYDFGKAFVVTVDSPEAATALIAKLRARFPGSTPAKVGDDAFLATDQYLGKLCIFRKGRYVAGYGNIAEGQDGVALATALGKRIP